VTWAQFDDGAWTDPMLCALSDRAERLHFRCWIYAADKLTDGKVTRNEVTRVAAMFGVTDAECLAKAITELVTWRLWTENLDGFVMVGWLDANRSRKKVLRDRETNRRKQAAWRSKKVAAEAEE
jgi:hypothetical protein